MIDRIKLRKEYKDETGEDWKMLCSTAQPTVEYIKWLENRLVKNCSIPDVTTSSCDHDHQKWQGNPKRRICQICGDDRTEQDGW